jgi:hypothetical protein
VVNEVYVRVFTKEVAHLLVFYVLFCGSVRRGVIEGGGVHVDILLFVRNVWGCECSGK